MASTRAERILSLRVAALAIERAALKSGNLSARGIPSRSESITSSFLKYDEMIRDASLVFRNRRLPSSPPNASTLIVPKGSVKFNEARFKRKLVEQ